MDSGQFRAVYWKTRSEGWWVAVIPAHPAEGEDWELVVGTPETAIQGLDRAITDLLFLKHRLADWSKRL